MTEQEKEDRVVAILRVMIEESHDNQNEFLIKLMNEHEISPGHAFLTILLEKKARNEEMIYKIKGNIIFWAFVTLMSALAWVGWWIWEHLQFGK